MSILIKGIPMPTGDCLLCIISPDGSIQYKENFEERWHDGAAIEIQPHGRLIDADELTTVTEMVNGEWKTYVEVFEIADAPTIIPAEEGE